MKVTSSMNSATRRLKTEFLVQLDGASTKTEDRILVIGATNLPNQLDKAALRRFSRKVLIDLPDLKAKKSMITKLLSKVPNKLSEADISDVAYRMERTHHCYLVFSANDVKIAVKEAAMAPLRDHTY
jgi:SpoVK/Ycf46/Vps4 family AAA+-type ATPase